MGASQSRPESDEKVFSSETPIQVQFSSDHYIYTREKANVTSHCISQFSQDVVNHLSDHLASPDTPPERQSTIDAHIRSRIQSELEHLREEEEQVKAEIERALEKENLDRERAMAGEESEAEDGAAGGVKSSTTLMGDLEEVRRKVEKYHSRHNLEGLSEVQAKGEAVTSCYK